MRLLLERALPGIALLAHGGVALAQGIITVPTADLVMEAAIAKARATLPDFRTAYGSPQPGDGKFAVKIVFPTTGNNSEHIWASVIELNAAAVTAKINNTPRDIPNLRFGEQVSVPIDRISDWMFERGGKLHGAQTLRAMLSRMPKQQADEFRARLAPE